jgi:hypothetical protein
MEITETRLLPKISFVALQCDVCKKIFKEPMDIQEFIRIHEIGGYSSKIGDDIQWKIDICQECFYSAFGEYIRKGKDI